MILDTVTRIKPNRTICDRQHGTSLGCSGPQVGYRAGSKVVLCCEYHSVQRVMYSGSAQSPFERLSPQDLEVEIVVRGLGQVAT